MLFQRQAAAATLQFRDSEPIAIETKSLAAMTEAKTP